jgi:hypothetical protein
MAQRLQVLTEGVAVGRTKAVKPRRLFVAVAAAVEGGPISEWKTDRLGMGHKPRLKWGVPAGGFRRESLCIAPFRDGGLMTPWDAIPPS